MKNKNLEFIVSASNEESFKRTLQIIYGFIANNEDVPHVPVKYLLSILLSKKNYNYRTYAQKAEIASKYVLDFLFNHDEYQLNWKLKNIDTGESTKYDISIFAQVILQAYFLFEEDLTEKCKKDDAVKFFYKALMEELHTPTTSLTKQKKIRYRIKVMVGVFAMSVEHKLSTKKNPVPYEIFQAVRNSLKIKSKVM